MKRIPIIITAVIIFVSIMTKTTVATSEADIIHIDRKGRTLYVLKHDRIIYRTHCGTGKGGLKTKKNMSDLITPTGDFKVDLILYKKSKYNAVSKNNIDKYKHSKKYGKFIISTGGLNILLENMNSIDFDKNGIPDYAYGTGYIGLNSDMAITGPKMKAYNNVPYWFSIAIHGTPNKDNIGKANSGGCIHLSEKDLSYLIETDIVKIGTKVIISDLPPKI